MLLLRSVLALTLLSLATCTTPVLIIGGGVAGASAAYHLYQHKISFLIIEATDRVGGRIRNAPLGNDGLQVEQGANWMQGYRPGVPFFDFVDKYVMLKHVRTDFGSVQFVENGTKVPDSVADPVWRTAQRAFERLYATDPGTDGRRRLGDFDVWAAIQVNGFIPRSRMEIAAWRSYIDFEYAVPSDVVSVKGLSPIYDPHAMKSSDMFVTDKRGYVEAVHAMLKMSGVEDTQISGEKLMLNSPVRIIKYGSWGAEVELRDGRKYNGSAVVCTVPLGVLKDSLLSYPKEKNRLRFQPPLDWRKRVAIAKMGMGDYLKVFVRFKRAVFSDVDPLFLMPLSCDEDGFLNIQNLNRAGYLPGSNVVLVTSTDAYSRELTCEDDDKVLRDVLRYVSTAVGRKIEHSEVEAYFIPNFGRNEFFRGSFSVRTAAMGESDVNALNRPVQGLFFAGEAHRRYGLNGYVHGAWDTGVIVARMVAHFLGKGYI